MASTNVQNQEGTFTIAFLSICIWYCPISIFTLTDIIASNSLTSWCFFVTRCIKTWVICKKWISEIIVRFYVVFVVFTCFNAWSNLERKWYTTYDVSFTFVFHFQILVCVRTSIIKVGITGNNLLTRRNEYETKPDFTLCLNSNSICIQILEPFDTTYLARVLSITQVLKKFIRNKILIFISVTCCFIIVWYFLIVAVGVFAQHRTWYLQIVFIIKTQSVFSGIYFII